MERGEGRFTTVDLLNKIKEYPNFPKEQQPVLSDRKYPTNKAGRIMLHPLRLNTDAVCEMDEIESSPIAQQGQNMTLHFDFSEEIEENHLKVLGTTLIDMFERNTLGVYRVRWGGVEHNSAFIRAVNKLRDGLERRRSTTKSPEKPMFGAADTTEIYDLIKDKTPNSPFLAAGTVYESQQSLSTGKPASPLPSTPPTSDFAIDADSGPTTMIQKVHQQQQKEPGQQPGEASSG